MFKNQLKEVLKQYLATIVSKLYTKHNVRNHYPVYSSSET